MERYLITNIGSASKKYALYGDQELLASAHFESIGDTFELTFTQGNDRSVQDISREQFDTALVYMMRELKERGLVSASDDIRAIGFRVVAPGTFFAEHRSIDAAYMEKLNSVRAEEPLHISLAIEELARINDVLPGTPCFGISDSAFHATLPEYARHYAINESDAVQFDIARFGYHGLSYASVVERLKHDGALPEKLIVCHLGSGASIAAIKQGMSVETSMGFSPLEGLIMATRPGDIDAGALIRLARAKQFDLAALEAYLYVEAGLKGLGGSGDVRELLKREEANDSRARLSLESFVHRIRKYIGAYAAVLGGLDTLVFTGTIGERSAVIRSRVCNDLSHLGVAISNEKNSSTVPSDGVLEIGTAGTRVLVIPTDEMGEMARVTANLLHR